jgi:hypothetical protein
MKKRLSPNFKKAFLGMSKREAIALLEVAKEEYNIYAVDYYETKHEVPKVIYVNYGNMGLHFDKHSRRIVWVS